ncbi:hypothetical protein KUCAC02_029571, partial [Chaenocephalus aceratus]
PSPIMTSNRHTAGWLSDNPSAGKRPLMNPHPKAVPLLCLPAIIIQHCGRVTRKEFGELTEDVKKLRRRVHQLEKEAKEGSAKASHSASHAKAEGSGLSTKAEGSPAEDDTTGLYQQDTLADEILADLIRHVDRPYAATRVLMLTLFTEEYIRTRSGRASNTTMKAKPIFDGRLYNNMLGTMRAKFPSLKTSDITAKEFEGLSRVQSVEGWALVQSVEGQ